MGAPGSGGPGRDALNPPAAPPLPDAQECTLKVQDGKFKLQDLLVVPMQRVLKYHLLLKVRPAGVGEGPAASGAWGGAHRQARLRSQQAGGGRRSTRRA